MGKICPPGWHRVNWSAKIWVCHGTPGTPRDDRPADTTWKLTVLKRIGLASLNQKASEDSYPPLIHSFTQLSAQHSVGLVQSIDCLYSCAYPSHPKAWALALFVVIEAIDAEVMMTTSPIIWPWKPAASFYQDHFLKEETGPVECPWSWRFTTIF